MGEEQLAVFEPQKAGGGGQRAVQLWWAGRGDQLAQLAAALPSCKLHPQTVSKALPLSSHCISGVGVMYRKEAQFRNTWAQQ